MVGSAFIIFCGITLYHLYIRIQNINVLKTCFPTMTKWPCPWSNKREVEMHMAEVEMGEVEVEDAAPSASKPTVSVVEFNKLREPLLTES